MPREQFLALRRDSPEFERYCTQAITETLRQSLESLYSQYRQRAAEQQTLTRTLGELVRHAPVACATTATLRDAAQKMADEKVRTIIVVDGRGMPVGLLTLVDLLERVVLPGRPLTAPVSEAMSTPIVSLPGSATAYEAMHVMAERGIRQVVVVEGGRLMGVVNERDLFALQRVKMRDVIEGLHAADSVESLRRAGDDIRRLTQNLLVQGVGAEPLTRTISSLNDALTRRLIEIVGAGHDLTDLDWCWLALGSEGRGEQTFATDQDNALLFAIPEGASADAARARLLPFAREVNAGLDRLGFPLCTGNVMASNPELCLSVDGVEGQVPAMDPRADAAVAAQRQHRVRLPAAVRRHDAMRRAARVASALHAGESRVPAADGAERARRRSADRSHPRVHRRRRAGRQGNARPQDARHAAVRRLRTRVRAGARHRGDGDGGAPARSRASGCTSRSGTCRRRSRRSISCSCCACGSRSSRRCRVTPIASIRTRCTRSTSGC